jgi:transcriptional regulator with XRE-family HTH domain
MSDPKSVLELGWKELLGMDGQLLVRVREELGLSPREMAERLACHHSTLNRYENEKVRIPVSVVQSVQALLEAERARRGLALSTEPAATTTPSSQAAGPGWRIHLKQGPLPPGTELLELVPAGRPDAKLTRIFAAVEPPRGGPEGPEGSPESPSPSGAPSARGQTSRAARAAMVVGMAVASVVLVSCVVRAVSGPERAKHELEPTPVSEEAPVDADSGPEQDMGSKPPADVSIPLPTKAYSWQKSAPCDLAKAEFEKVQGCWVRMPMKPPCPHYTVEDEGTCLLPVPGKKGKRPSAVAPVK